MTGEKRAEAPRWMRWLAILGILGNSFVFLVVNYWIYHARFLFIESHPDYVAIKPPTISRAISDNLIGDPFAFWIAVCAVILVLCMVPILMLYLRTAAVARAGGDKAGRALQRTVYMVAPLAVTSQMIAAVGMYMLSNFRFPDNSELHMTGSFIFFGFQSLTVVVSGYACWRIARENTVIEALHSDWSLAPWMCGLRWRLAIMVAAMAVGYVVLFVVKDFDLPFGQKAVYAIYVTLEPMVITAFLGYLGSFNIDMGRLLFRG